MIKGLKNWFFLRRFYEPSYEERRIVVYKGTHFLDDDGRILEATRNIRMYDEAKNTDFIYLDTGEHPKPHSIIPKSIHKIMVGG